MLKIVVMGIARTSAVSYMATAIYELPYEGAKEMLLVEDVDSKEYLAGLFNAMYDELPVHKSNNNSSLSVRMMLLQILSGFLRKDNYVNC